MIKRVEKRNINRDFVIENVIPCVRPKTEDEVLTAPLLDLDLYFRCVVCDDEEGFGSFAITEEMAEKFNLSVDELATAVASKAEESVTVKTMGEILGFDDDMNLMYVISNENGTFGAGSAFLAQGALQALSNKLDSDLYIIPCSVHELLAIPADIDRDGLDAIINNVNSEVLEPEERLGNHAYLFNKDLGFVAA